MDPQSKSLRIGAAVIGIAVLLRLLSGGILAPLIRLLTQPETVAVLMYLETGRVVRPYNAMTYPAESPGPEVTEPPPASQIPVFTQADGQSIRLRCKVLSVNVHSPHNCDRTPVQSPPLPESECCFPLQNAWCPLPYLQSFTISAKKYTKLFQKRNCIFENPC